MNLHPLGEKPLPPPLTTPGENGATSLGLHPCSEAMLAFASSLGGLVSAFHGEGDERTRKVKVGLGLSTKTAGCHSPFFL